MNSIEFNDTLEGKIKTRPSAMKCIQEMMETLSLVICTTDHVSVTDTWTALQTHGHPTWAATNKNELTYKNTVYFSNQLHNIIITLYRYTWRTNSFKESNAAEFVEANRDKPRKIKLKNLIINYV
uniref:Uncharacterized protein n=1 Tax=Cacopsylla melanoneura TaxID=428564 RepID=A0A8D9EBX7_9HEMI